MADALNIPEFAFRGDWLADGRDRQRFLEASSAEASRDPVALCAKAFADLRSGKSALLADIENRSLSTTVSGYACGSILVSTGGTTGRSRFARHTWETMSSAVTGLCGFLGVGPLRSWCCLPVWHVSGWMQVVRAIETGGDVRFGHYRDLAGEGESIDLSGRVVSLVPTQLSRLLSSAVAVSRLRGSRIIFLGGGPLRDDLAERAREAKLPVAPTYGLTETAGMITMLPPDLFLAGNNGVGGVLPHAELSLDEQRGTLRLKAKSLCLGYHDEDFSPDSWFPTDDLADVDQEGNWSILGRTDRIVNTGGEKVNPVEVEEAIFATKLVEDCLVAGISDTDWGERLVAICSPASTDVVRLDKALRETLSGMKLPKRIMAVDTLPRNAAGKPNATEVARLATG